MSTLDDFITNALSIARKDGLTEENKTFTMPLLGTRADGSAFKRTMIVSEERPKLVPGDDSQVWLNPKDATIHKSNNWKGDNDKLDFESVKSYDDIFNDPEVKKDGDGDEDEGSGEQQRKENAP